MRQYKVPWACMKKQLFLVLDGNSLLHRAWHAIPPLTTKDGKVVNAVYGFTNVIEKMLDTYKPDYMAVAWDLPGATFRHEEYAEYKGTREKKEQELYDQIDDIQRVLDAYGIPSLSAEGMEADDILGTIAKTYGPQEDTRVKIVTGDLDALQLVDDDVEVTVFIKGLSQTKTYDADAVEERYGLRPDQIIDLKALMGDSSDNIPGLAGVGSKTATQLLQEHGSIEGIYQAIEHGVVPEKFAKKFRGQEDHLKQMQRLVTIVHDVDLQDFTAQDAKLGQRDVDALIELFTEYEFRRLIEQYTEKPTEKPKKMVAKKSSSKTMTSVKSINQLTGMRFSLAIEMGPASLFGGHIQHIALCDGNAVWTAEHPQPDDLDAVIQCIRRAKEVYIHDAKAIFHALHVDVAEDIAIFDTMVAAYLLSSAGRNFDFETCVREYVSDKNVQLEQVDDMARQVFALAEAEKAKLQDEGMQDLSQNIEMPLISILYSMEKHGILVDKQKLAELSTRFGQELDERTNKIYALAGKEFNINSPSQLSVILFEELELPTKKIKKTKSGYSTAASELEKLWDQHEIIPLVSEYREFAKLKSTYVDALPKLVAEDGRIHSNFNQTVAATGRLSSSDPNLQNIPARTEIGREIRKAFVVPDGYTLVAIDYSQFELRLAASMAEDASFIEAFNQGADIHTRTAAEILGKHEEEVTKSERSAAKAINFGILYGMGSTSLAKTTGFSRTEAKGFIEAYFEKHPKIKEYLDEKKAFAHEYGYVETLYGRKRYLPDISSGIPMLVAAAERMAINMPIQGTQADLIKMAMISVQQWLRRTEYDAKMLLQVHDELVFEIKDDDVDNVLPAISRIMETIAALAVPLVVDVETGPSWGDLQDWE